MTWDTLQFRINYSVLGIDCWLLCCYAALDGNQLMARVFGGSVVLWIVSMWAIMFASERKRVMIFDQVASHVKEPV